MLLFYIRHGDPVYDPDSLTALGQEQARALAKRLASYGLDEIYSSSSNRAQMTAKPTAEYLKKEVTLCPWAHENIVWEGMTVYSERLGGHTWVACEEKHKALFNSPEIRAMGAKWYDHPSFADTKFKSTVLAVDRSVDDFLLSLGYRHDRENGRYIVERGNNKRVALFAHEGFGWAFISSLLDIPYPQFCTRFALGHSSMTVIEFRDEGGFSYPRVLSYSNDAHLYREGLMTGFGYVGGVKF